MSTIQLSSTQAPFQHSISIRAFEITVDEPIEIGGSDAGPTPTELVFSGLGACKAITLKMYAARKGWPLEAVDAGIEAEQIERRYHITVHLTLTGELTSAQRERLLEISNKCPVHKLLAPGAEITTVLV
ncbi:MAG: OsmC family protein [Cyanobacteria bacterium J06614_10]